MSGRIVAVIGAAGGCGTSLLAGALALCLARRERPVWLVDLDLERGDLAGAWDLEPSRSLDDLAPVADELGPEHLRRAAAAHRSGVSVLAAAGRPGASGRWNARRVGALLASVAREGEVVVDLASAGVVGQAAVAAADSVLFACPATVAGARRAYRRIEGWRARDLDGRIGLVGVRTAAPELSSRALGRSVGAAVLAEVPWSRREAVALGMGRWPARGRRPLAGAVERMAEILP